MELTAKKRVIIWMKDVRTRYIDGGRMRFLYFTDTHIRGTTPENRKDNFPGTLKRKLLEIRELVEQQGVDYVLNGGDWFDRPDVSPAVVREFAIIINGFTKPIITIAGNHDIFGQNPESLERTMLGLIEGIGLVRLLQSGEELVLEQNGVRVQITGSSYNYAIDGDGFREYYLIKKRNDVKYAVHLVHGMLLNKPFLREVQYTQVKEITDTEADITLAGHYHSGFGVVQREGKYFINPGSIVRISNSLSEMERKPKVVILDLKDSIQVTEIALKSAKPGSEVLDRSKVEESKNRLVKIHQFFNGMGNLNYSSTDMKKIIEDIAVDQSVEAKVREEAIRRLGEAEEILAVGDESE